MRKKERKLFFGEANTGDSTVIFMRKENCISTFCFVVDRFIAEVATRSGAHEILYHKFYFLTNLLNYVESST